MIRKIIAVAATFSILNAFSLNDIVTDTVGDITNGIGKQFGLPDFDVQCDIGVQNIDIYSVCDVVDKLNLDLGNDFSIGGCSISVADPLSCQKRALRDFCNSQIGKLEDAVEGYRVSATNAIVDSSVELLGTGGKIVGDFTSCDHIKNMIANKKLPSGKTLKQIYEDTGFKAMKEHGIFNTVVLSIRDCEKSNGNEKKCKDLSRWNLVDDMLNAEKDISIASKQSNNNSEAYVKGAIETESMLSKKLYRKCSNSSNPSQCVKDVKSSDVGHVKKRDAAIANTETASAIRFKLLKNAARQKQSFVYRGSAVPKRLPIESRAQYISGTQRATASDIVTEALFFQNTSLSKEALVVLDNKMVDASEPFLESAAIAQIIKLMGE